MTSSDYFRAGTNRPRNAQSRAKIPSDQLPQLREFLSISPLLQEIFGETLQLRIVIDADIAQKELIWRLRKRRNPTARTALHEAIDSETIVALAPSFLEQEIKDHIAEIAARANVPVSCAVEEWQKFRSCLHFYDPEPVKQPDPNCIDPDDLPYKWVCEQLGAHAIYSTDNHFKKMSVPLISVQLDLTVRDYARANSERLTIHLGTTFSLAIGFRVLTALCKTCMQMLKNLPSEVRAILLAGAFIAVAHPKLRSKGIKLFRSAFGQIDNLRPALGQAFIGLLIQAAMAESTAARTGAEIQSLLPPPRKLPAIVIARSVCLVNKEPLSLREIEEHMAKGGYVSKSQNFRAYLRRLLRKDERFIEVSPGQWTVRTDRIASNS